MKLSLSGVIRGALLLASLGVASVRADLGTQQVELAASGRFDQLEKLMEAEAAQRSLGTRDRHALCFAYSKTKRYDKLLPCLNLLEQSVAKGDRRTRLFGLDDATPLVYIMRADALIELAQYGPAAVEAKKALDWLTKEDSDDKDMVVNALAALSLSATLAGDKETGTKYAMQIEKVKDAAYANARAMALGRVYIALGDFERALEGINSDATFKLRSYLDNLVSGALFTGVSNWVWAELPRGFMLNKALLETGRIDEAKAGLDKLLAVPQAKANGEIYWLMLDDRGRIAEKEGDAKAAIDYYKQAIDVIEQQRATINTEANKIGFIGDKQALYGKLIALFYRSQRMAEAYEYIERAKARAMVDVLAAKEEFALPPEAGPETARLLQSYREAERESRTQNPVDMRQSDSGQRSAAGGQIKALKEAAPELASLVSVSPVTLQEVRQRLLPGEALIEYYLLGKDLYASLLTAETIRTYRLDASGLEEGIRKFRKQIDDTDEAILPQAQKLYQQLLAPLAADLGNRKLLIIPHGVLHYLPFSALHDGKDYLVQNHAVHYLPSAGVLKYLRPSRTTGLDAILIFGNPDLGDPKLDLPSAEEEARKVAAMLPKSELLVRDKATKTAFKRFAPGFPYLHIASHGQFQAETPLNSRLLLRSDAEGDGSLTVGELYNMRLNADLITLSACETGLGKVLNGDDMVGLTRGFLYAGSRNIVASLWEVDDDATSQLMQSFYSHLKNREAKLDALRQAQQETRKKYPHPFFWAAFFLTGQGL